MPRVLLTPTAGLQFRLILEETKRRHGAAQMKSYSSALKKGIGDLPRFHENSRPQRVEMKADTDFEIQRIQHHYVIYKILENGTCAVVALFFERWIFLHG
jgi:plasmid stabilization system protein ParE